MSRRRVHQPIIPLFAALLILAASPAAFAQVDVMFEDDFENMPDLATPDQFLPSGSANPDWDNQILNPLNNGISADWIVSNHDVGNPSKIFKLLPFENGKPLLLGANFSPSSERYVIVEYDVFMVGAGLQYPASEIIYADGYGNLDGTGGNTKIAIDLSFSLNQIDGTYDPPKITGSVYRIQGEDNNVTSFPPADPSYYQYSLAAFWTKNAWFHVQVIADQQNHTFDLKLTNKTSGLSYSLASLPFNDPTAGYIRKVWFMETDFNSVYFDNILVYQSASTPPPGAPTITMNEFTKGPTNANVGLDIHFGDDSDLQAIEYKIGAGGAWTPLTSNGTTVIDCSGPGDKTIMINVWITNTDFAALPEGTSQIYFRATNNLGLTAESPGPLAFLKDTQLPNLASVTVPGSSIVPALTTIQGLAADATGGIPDSTAVPNSLTFTLQRLDNNQYWSGNVWQAGSTNLPTAHAAAPGGTSVSWANSGNLPSGVKLPLGVLMRIQVSVTDLAGNGPYAGAPVTFMVMPGFPAILMNVSSVGPVRGNAFAGIDVDFSDETDLQAIQYRIGAAGAWTDLTSNGVNPFNLSGGSDTSVTSLVYISNTDFTALPEGRSDLYFRATDNNLPTANTNTTATPLVFIKDTGAPSVATVTSPSANPFSSLPTVAGQLGDSAGGSGFAANSATFTIRRSSDMSYWTGSAWGGLAYLGTSHPATSDSSVVSWVKNAAIPTLSQLTTGVTYTFAVQVTDRAGNTATALFSSMFADVPEVASVTSPTNGLITATPFTSLAIQGQAADHEGGSGLNADSTTFTLRRIADGQYWNGTAWQALAFYLSTTHAATSSSAYATWTPASALPAAGPLLSDGDYQLQAKATNRNGGTLTGTAVTVTYSGNPPLISSGTMSALNTYVTLTFSEKVWSDAARSSAIVPADFAVVFQQNGGAVTNSTISGFYADSGLTTPLSAATGYTTVYAKLNNTGGPASGVETITVTANATAIYDNAGVVMSSSQTTGAILFNPGDTTAPSVSARETADLDGDGLIDALHITFSEAVSDASITMPASFDVVGLSGEAFSSTTNGDTANDADIYITFTENASYKTDALPNLTVALGAVKDLAGNSILANGPFAATDKAGPAILSATASDATVIRVGIDADDTVTITFSEAIKQPADITAGNINTVLALSGGHSWLDGAGGITSASWSSSSVLVVTLRANTSPPTVAVGDTITVGGGVITDVPGNPASTVPSPAITGTFSADTVPPGLSTLVTADTNGNGFIDQLVVTFDENVDPLTIVQGAFSVSLGSIVAGGVVDNGVPGDAIIWVNLTDNALYTDAKPALSIDAGGIEDLPGNPNALISGFLSSDGAAPVIMNATSDTGLTTLTVRFSEAVDTSNTGGGNLVAGDFTYGNVFAGGATGIAGMAEGDGLDRVVTITVNPAFVSNDFTQDTIAAAAGQIFDLANNPMPTGSVAIALVDLTPPSIIARETRDLNGNGYLDALRITFNEPVSDGTVNIGNFAIAGASGLAFSPTAEGDVANNAVIYITFTDGILASDATPNLTVADGAVQDLAGNSIVANEIAATDKAGPAILSSVAFDATPIKVGIDAGDTVTITFSEATDQPTIDAGNINTVLALSGGHSWLDGAGGITSASWSSSSVLVVTLRANTSPPTVAVGDTITLDGIVILDAAAGNPASTVPSPAITGTFSADTVPPGVASVLTQDTSGKGYLDRLIVTFNENVDETTIVPGDFAVSAGTITGVVDDGIAGNAVIWVELLDFELLTDALPALTIAPAGIKDLPGNPNVLISAFPSTDVVGPAILSAAASDAANIRVGIDADDTVTITFSEAIKQPADITAGNINTVLALSGGHSWLDGAGGLGSPAPTWSSPSVLVVTLRANTSQPTITVGDTITVGGGVITDVPGNPASTVPSPAITGTFSSDTVPPDLSTVVTVDTNGNGFIDRLVVSFDENVDPLTIVQGAFSVSLGSIVAGGVVDNGVPGDAIIWVNLTESILATDATPSLSIADSGIQDLAGNAFVAVAGFASTDGAAPVILSATSVVGSTALLVTFSEAVDTSNTGGGNLVAGDFTYGNVFAGGATGIAGMAEGDGLDRVVTVTANAPFVLGDFAADTIRAAASQIYDLANNAASTTAMAFSNSDTTAPTVLNVETADRNGNGYLDALHITFSEPVRDSTVTAANFAFSGGVTAIGFATGVAADDAELFITFTDGVLGTAATPTLTYTSGTLKDLNGNSLATTGALPSTDKAGPAIISAVAGDGTTVQVGIDADDTVTITFSEAIKQPADITAGNINTVLALSGGHSWLDGAGGLGSPAPAWSSPSVLVVTLRANTSSPTVAVGDTITLGGGVITDTLANASSTAAFSAISGSFSADSTPPTIVTRETADLNGNGYLDALRLTFSEPVRDSTVTATNFAFSGGVTAIGFATGAAADDAELFITFTDGVLGTAATPTVTYTAGTLKDMPGNLMLSTGALPSTDKAGPAILSAVASDATNIRVGIDPDDTVTITFSEAIKQPADINAGNINTVLVLSGGHGWLDGAGGITSAAWSSPTVLVVTLRANTSQPTITVGDTITISGGVITDIPANPASTAASPAITGTFSADTTPPTILTRETADLNSNGFIDAVRLVFSEPVRDSTMTATDFSFSGGVTTIGFATGAAGNDAELYITFTDGVLGTQATPTVSYTAGTLTDMPGNFLASAGAAACADKAPPVILSRETADLNGSGYLDAIHITFSEAVSDATLTAGNFDVAGVTGEAFNPTTNGDTANDADIYIMFGDGILNTAATPTVTYSAGTLRDLPGNSLASTGALASVDKAGPALLSAVAGDGIVVQAGIDADDTVTLTFSEATSKPAIDAGNIDAALDLGGHTWLDGAAGIGSAVWNAAGDVLTVTLSVAGGAPSVAVGDAITLDATITDPLANVASTSAFSAISGSFVNLSAPSIASLVTADTNGDGFIDRLILTFDRTMDETQIVQAAYSVSTGTILPAGVTDDGAAGDPTIWVNLTDGVLGTGAEPRLTIQAGGIRDTGGSANNLISAFPSTDAAAPRLMYTLAVVGEKTVYVRFSEPVNRSGSSFSPADFGGSIGGNTILYVVLADPRGGYADGVFLSLANPILCSDVLAQPTFPLAGLKAVAADRKGLLLQSPDTTHRLSDLLLGAVQPVWAVNFAAGSQGGVTAKSFNGSETLDYKDVTLQALSIDAAAVPEICFDSNVSQKTNSLWLPTAIPGLTSGNGSANGPQAAGSASPAPGGTLYNYQLPQGLLERGSLELVFRVGGLYSLRVLNPKDPRGLAMWTLNVQDQSSQRGSVTILDNVLRTGLGGKTTLVYTLDRRGSVTILVSDMRGNIVAVLVRAVQDAGQHSASWDGRNRAGRIVAPGLYYVKVVGPGINEVRKVLVGK